MTTGYEAGFYRQFDVLTQSVRSIETSLNTIANCMAAAEKRARENQDPLLKATLKEKVEDALAGSCVFDDCVEPVIVMLNGERFCQTHIDAGFAMMRPAMEAVRRGMADLEQAQKEQRDDPER